ncbi:hypothetical protein SDC9_59059 [bioreactor metagenome]|uniref:N-acetylmuramoyl-L-alanine amidase n=1 Tax=bioreactor metagenome TaxID=1076179 RepID=A0A644X951_9ZZZZ
MSIITEDEKLELNCGEIPAAELSGETGPIRAKLAPDSSGLDINTDYPASTKNYTAMSGRTIKYIVIHYVGTNGTAYSVAKYFQTPGRNSSAHYVVGLARENGRIYQLVAPQHKAWHCGTSGKYYHPECRNANSIGIETACRNDTSDLTASSLGWYFDDVTVEALVRLTKLLMNEYGIDADHVVRHYDVTHKTCPAMWVHDEAAWRAFKLRLIEGNATVLVAAVAAKIGLLSPDYWVKVLTGGAVPRAEHVKALLEKVCAAKGLKYSYQGADGILNLNSDDYWTAVLAGKATAGAATVTALFEKIYVAI